jgi:hypothetical protein
MISEVDILSANWWAWEIEKAVRRRTKKQNVGKVLDPWNAEEEEEKEEKPKMYLLSSNQYERVENRVCVVWCWYILKLKLNFGGKVCTKKQKGAWEKRVLRKDKIGRRCLGFTLENNNNAATKRRWFSLSLKQM